MRAALVIAALLTAGCASFQPAVGAACSACNALAGTGLCAMTAHLPAHLLRCQDGSEPVVLNWDELVKGKESKPRLLCGDGSEPH